MTDPTRRFTGRVDDYIRYRPGYPPEVLGLLRRECGLTESTVVADIGSGTGNLARLLLDNGNRVIMVEPNDEMRTAGERLLSGYWRLESLAGTAEAKISRPLSTRTWKVGCEIIFSGSAADEQDGTLLPSELSWSLIMHHCYSAGTCHEHRVRDFPGVAGGSFVAPDHEYPAYLELRLTATDSRGLTDTESLRLDPKTVQLRFASRPTSARLVVGSSRTKAPFSRTVIVGSANLVSAPSRRTWGGRTYFFHHWSDGRARTHNIIAPSSETAYSAVFRLRRR